MSELRHDPIQKRWVIIATDRAQRPDSFAVEPEKTIQGAFCPFCYGNEESTPPEITAVRDRGSRPNTAGWKIRVVPNKFPALRIEGGLERSGVGIYDRLSGIGAHEVVIESPDHRASLIDFDLDHSANVFRVLQERHLDLMRDGRFRYVILFKNQGMTAGASLPHPHHQVIAVPVTPKTVSTELQSSRQHYMGKERCIFCDIIQQEIGTAERIVALTERFVAFCPYASRFPFEVFVAPRNHEHTFAETSAEDLRGLAAIMKDVLGRLAVGLKNPPFNYMFHSAPNTEMKPSRPGYWATVRYDYHWHVEILPRLTRVAGFEWGTGFYINPVPPENAAAHLRAADPTKAVPSPKVEGAEATG
ncbi:MAG: galactose-1-phosphate uridylyltransferase [Candidatus Latescibacterota bacterium]|nr:MAG: galactose-1-phosphate uridylyltransferase [Candidatus Latescibacterota bacterium]